MSSQPLTEANTLINNCAPTKNVISGSSSQSIIIRLQAKKKVADTQPEDPNIEEGATAKLPDLPPPKHHLLVA